MIVTIALARRCKVCKRWAISNSRNYEIGDIEEIDSLPMDKIEVTQVGHCGQKAVGTHIGIKIGNTEMQYQPLNTSDMPIGGITYSKEAVDLMDVGAKEQLAGWKENKKSLLDEYWLWLINNDCLNKAINQISQKEFETAFISTKVPYKRFLYKQSGTETYRELNKEDQKLVFIAVSDSMITEIIWSMSAMDWPVEEWKKKYGKTRILWPVLFMPINNHLLGMRISANARLGGQLNADGDGLSSKRIIGLESTITRCNTQVAKLTDTLSQKNVEIAQLEVKLAEAYATNRQLTATLDRAKAELKSVKCAPSSKSESMKSLIREMRDQLKQYEKEEVLEGPVTLEEDRMGDVANDVAVGLSDAVKVGILGGWRREQTDKYPNILTSPGLEDSVGFDRLLRDSGVIVVLINHVSHQTMWSAKSFVAMEQNKPILYTSHLSIPIILDEVSALLKRNQQNT